MDERGAEAETLRFSFDIEHDRPFQIEKVRAWMSQFAGEPVFHPWVDEIARLTPTDGTRRRPRGHAANSTPRRSYWSLGDSNW